MNGNDKQIFRLNLSDTLTSALLAMVLAVALSYAAGCRTTSPHAASKIKDETHSSAATIASSEVRWTSKNGNIYLGDQVFHMKGVNWFGLETPAAWLFGLEYRSLDSILALLAQNGVNSIRVPISVKYALDLDLVSPRQDFQGDTDLKGKPWSAVLEKLITRAQAYGITILLDMHTITPGDNLATGLWYTKEFSKEDFRQAWVKVLGAFGHHWNIWGLDLKNELHEASWGAGLESDWNTEVETLVPLLAKAAAHYRGLFVVQGIWHGQIGEHAFGAYYDTGKNAINVYDPEGYGAPEFWDYWWGGNLAGLKTFPLKMAPALEDRIAYTIHFYGPAVWPHWYYEDPTLIKNALGVYNNPDKLDQVLDLQHSFIEARTGRALIIGEWGGVNGPMTRNLGGDTPMRTYDDSIIVSRIAEWFPRHCMGDAMWWAINPESTDTGGLLKPGYQEIETGKFAAMAKMMPYPTALKFDGDSNTITIVKPGAFHPEARCKA